MLPTNSLRFDFPTFDDWSNSHKDANESCFELNLLASRWDDKDAEKVLLNSRRHRKEDKSKSSPSVGRSLSQDFPTNNMNLAWWTTESAFGDSLSDLSVDDDEEGAGPTVSCSASAVISTASCSNKPKESNHRPRSKNDDAAQTSRERPTKIAPPKMPIRQASIGRHDSVRSVRRISSEPTKARLSLRHNDIQPVHRTALDSDTSMPTGSEYGRSSSSRRDVSRTNSSNSKKHRRRSRSTKPTSSNDRHPTQSHEKKVSDTVRRTPNKSQRMSLLGPSSQDHEGLDDNEADCVEENYMDDKIHSPPPPPPPPPRVRTLVRRNSFAKLQRGNSVARLQRGNSFVKLQQRGRTASSRSLVLRSTNYQTKADARALTARVQQRPKIEQELAAFPQRPAPEVVEDNRSTTSTSLSSDLSEPTISPAAIANNVAAPTSTHRPPPLTKPVVQDDVHPVLCLLSGDLWSNDQAIVVGAFHQLTNLCRDDEQHQSIFALAGYCAICGVIRKWYHDATVLTAAFRLIQSAETSAEHFAAGMVGCGALEYIVGAMQSFATDGPLQAAACGALATLVSSTSTSSPSRKLAVDLNGPVVLVAAMKSFPDLIEIQQKAIATLWSMARFPQLRSHLEVGSIRVDAMSVAIAELTRSLVQQVEATVT